MALALLIDAVVGWPGWLYARIGHPVTWLGQVISALDARWNDGALPEVQRRRNGVWLVTLLVLGVGLVGLTVQMALPQTWLGTLLLGLLAWPLIAVKSMADHVKAVSDPLQQGDLAQARFAVSMIVGRHTAQLDEAGVTRAAIESLAENTSDGITAPLFWGALFGLPGIAAYKVVNTLDSMVGYRTEKHAAFGWASARLDDVVNWVPARLTGALFALVSSAPRESLRAMFADARQHRSPNAGWPEAAMAGALGVRLAGPRVYADGAVDDPYVYAAGREPVARDLARGLALYWRAMGVAGLSLALGGMILA
ncbi:adenosylcobinamide-phosphate synthase CbiB [Pseudaestuariivita sp.]|uniref:adenosylcobinamide-phosphate synthase CbiB n=1 Tax=Pseudaestuariivita sp. TaxID=2211669 RepID=UPI0040593C3E